MNTTETLDCGHGPSPHGAYTTGYGTRPNGERICFACCAEEDRRQLERDGKGCLYLTPPNRAERVAHKLAGREPSRRWHATNWPGTLRIPVSTPRKGRHNMAGSRYDVWFTFQGRQWHGVQYGENTQVLHIRRLKGRH